MLTENRTFSILTGLLIAFAVGACSGYWVLKLPVEAPDLSAAEFNRLEIANQQLTIENDALKQQLRSSQYLSINTSAPLPKSPGVADSSLPSISESYNSQIKPASPTDLAQGVFKSAISEKIQQNPLLDLTAELANKFASEAVDIAWASQQEDLIRDLFLDNPTLANISPDSIECRSLRCRIRIALVALDDGNQNSIAFANVIASTPALSQLGIVSGFDYERAALEIYLPRSGEVNLLQ